MTNSTQTNRNVGEKDEGRYGKGPLDGKREIWDTSAGVVFFWNFFARSRFIFKS